MRALVMHRFGGPKAVEWTRVDDLTAGLDDVVVEVEAVTVNRALDLAVGSGDYMRRPALSCVLGAESVGRRFQRGLRCDLALAGMRIAVFPVVRPARPGVAAILFGVDVWDGHAEQVRVPAGRLSRAPELLAPMKAAVIDQRVPPIINLLAIKALVKVR